MQTRTFTPLLVAIACLAGLACPPAALRGQETEPLAIGAPAPDFSLPGVDGKTWKLADFAEAKVLVVIFTCNHCPTAQAYEERIMRLTRDYAARGVAVVGISPNDPGAVRLDELGYTDLGDSLEDMKRRAADRGFNFPYLFDGETQSVSRAYGALATPHCFVFDSKRALRYAGRIDDAETGEVKSPDLLNAVDALLAGKPVPVERTKCFGCSVKWRDKRPEVARSLERWANEKVNLDRVDVDGVRELVANRTSKLRVINFWATWCAPCIAEFPGFVELHRMYRRRDCEIITVSIDEATREAAARSFLEKQQASMRNVIVSGAEREALTDAVGADWGGIIPFTLVIEPGGEVVRAVEGQADFAVLKKDVVGFVGRTYAGRKTTEVVHLLDGAGLERFYTFLGPTGKDSDPDGVFRFGDGVLRISGQHRGYLATREVWSHYRLVGEFRWGERTWDGRGGPRDSGLFFHANGEDRLFMSAFECQYKEGQTGDLCLVGGGLSVRRGEETIEGGCAARPGGRVDRPRLDSRAEGEIEKPRGEWNTVEITCQGDRIRIAVNGTLLHDVTSVAPSSGRIYLQSYNAELFYRRLDLYPLP